MFDDYYVIQEFYKNNISCRLKSNRSRAGWWLTKVTLKVVISVTVYWVEVGCNHKCNASVSGLIGGLHWRRSDNPCVSRDQCQADCLLALSTVISASPSSAEASDFRGMQHD